MTDTRRKGTKHEKEAMELYESWGYKTWKPANSSRAIGPGRFISESQDICNVFDFLAYNEHNLHFVQVKTWDKSESQPSKARKAIDEGGFPIWSVNLVVMARLPRKPGKFVIWLHNPELGKWQREHSENWALEIDGGE